MRSNRRSFFGAVGAGAAGLTLGGNGLASASAKTLKANGAGDDGPADAGFGFCVLGTGGGGLSFDSPGSVATAR